MESNRIQVNERILAGDVALLKLDCPRCKTDHLTGYPLGVLECCGFDATCFELEVRHMRLLCGTRRRPGRISKTVVRQLLDIQGPNCAYCQEAFGEGYHVEHIVPLCVGGSNNVSNLCLSCPRCNALAGRKVFATFEGKRQYVLGRR